MERDPGQIDQVTEDDHGEPDDDGIGVHSSVPIEWPHEGDSDEAANEG